jgi:hypothetical protein
VFWAAAAHPHKTAAERGERLIEYLKRAMLHSAPLTATADLAWFLASYARDAHARVDAQADLPALASLRTAMENALGMAFQGPEGEDFFGSTLVQTFFYGVFAAWVLWHKENPARSDSFDWRLASYFLNVPVIQALFEQVSAHSKLKALGLIEPLDWAGATLNRVDRAAFFAKFEEEQYNVGLNTEWGIKKFNLDDLYIRFFRLAERRITEMTGRGVVCYISNHSCRRWRRKRRPADWPRRDCEVAGNILQLAKRTPRRASVLSLKR